MQLRLAQLVQYTGGTLLSGSKSIMISGISTDSRQINAGDLFIALKGERYDAHDFIAGLLEKGIAAVLISDQTCLPDGNFSTAVIMVEDTLKALQKLAAAYRQLFPVPIVAVTGSVGKTTTKDLLAACLSPAFHTHKTQGNFNNEIGLPLTLLDLQAEHQVAVVEIGMRAPLEIHELASVLQPTHAIITNVEAVHLETMGSLENIAQAKCEVLEFIQPGCIALLHGDNELLLQTAAAYPCRKITFGYNENCDIQILSVINDGSGIQVSLRIFAVKETFFLPLPVDQLAANLAAAVGMASLLGVSLLAVKNALKNFAPGDKRMNRIPLKDGGMVIDDTYNANPLSMIAALEACRQISKGRKMIAVLGDMLELGQYESEGHKSVGRKAAALGFDILVTIGQRAKYYKEGALETGMPVEQIFQFTDSNEALKWIRENLSQKDVILFKASRGMHLDKLVQGFID